MGRQLGETALKKRVKKVVKDNEALPFGTCAPVVNPKTMCDKQRLWVMNGLRYLKAPSVLWLNIATPPGYLVDPYHQTIFATPPGYIWYIPTYFPGGVKRLFGDRFFLT